MISLIQVYNKLLDEYGFQGWWPLLNHNGYRPKDYSLPKSEDDVFEICVGAFLTQNTNWNNVSKALVNLKNADLISANKIINVDISKLGELIKPAGYFNQKSNYLKIFSEFFLKLSGVPNRDELLNLKGVGPETADSILLYAFKVPVFVVDAYTKRFFSHIGLIKQGASYGEVQSFCMNNLPKDYKLFQEFHALIVEHCKNYYSKKPFGVGDDLFFLKKKNIKK